MYTTTLLTPLGTAVITGNEDGIAGIQCVGDPVESSTFVPAILRKGAEQLDEYIRGQRKDFTVPLRPVGTSFQQAVWQLLREIPFGKTISYLELSRRLGDERAIRAVASANGKNPIWVLIPCHRVIGSNGDLTGYAGGLWRKQWLLDHERPTKQLSLDLGV